MYLCKLVCLFIDNIDKPLAFYPALTLYKQKSKRKYLWKPIYAIKILSRNYDIIMLLSYKIISFCFVMLYIMSLLRDICRNDYISMLYLIQEYHDCDIIMSLLRQNILYLQHNYLIYSDNHRLQLQVVVASNSGKFEIITLKIWRSPL